MTNAFFFPQALTLYVVGIQKPYDDVHTIKPKNNRHLEFFAKMAVKNEMFEGFSDFSQ